MVTIRASIEKLAHMSALQVRTKMPNRTIAYYASIIKRMGYDINKILSNAGISPITLETRSNSLSLTQLLAFLSEALIEARISSLGLEVGKLITLKDFGILGYAMESTPTLGDALHTMGAYHEITGGIWSPQFDFTPNGTCDLTLDFHISATAYEYFFVEEMLTGLLRLVEQLTQYKDTSYKELHLDYEKPAHAREYYKLFSCPIYFSSDKTRIVFDRSLLERPCQNRDVETARECELICKKLLHEMASAEISLRGKINRVLLASPANPPTHDQVARELALSPRSFSRRLRELDTSYQKILDEFRCALVTTYLEESNISLDAIAQMAGFADKSCLIKAFRRWTGKNPSHYRAN
jgi:AraC-like DNA-binding protein